MSDKIYMKEITLPIVETGEDETYSFVQTDDDLETAGDAADAKTVGDQLGALKEDITIVPSNKVSVQLSGKRTHDGLKVTASTSNFYNYFGMYALQYSKHHYRTGNAKPHVYPILIEYGFPEHAAHHMVVFYHAYTSTKETMIDANTTNVTRTASSVSANTMYGRLSLNNTVDSTKYTEGIKYRIFRPALEIYDDHDVLTKIIYYPAQFVYELVSYDPFNMVVSYIEDETASNELVWGLTLYNDIRNFSVADSTKVQLSDSQYWQECVNSYITEGNELYTIVPYSSNERYVVAFARIGSDVYSLSDNLLRTAPSTTMTQSVSSGDTFMLDDLWYKATSDLAVGDTLVVGTNCEAIEEPVIPTEELPTIPTTDGTYHLEVSVASGVPTMTWVTNT